MTVLCAVESMRILCSIDLSGFGINYPAATVSERYETKQPLDLSVKFVCTVTHLLIVKSLFVCFYCLLWNVTTILDNPLKLAGGLALGPLSVR